MNYVLRPSKQYRPDIDGLRAVSVLAVLAFHGFPGLAPGGFVGVDVFFVISGFLISGIILDEMHDGAFSLRIFYVRRVRRIFPALVTVLIASLLAGWWLLLPAELLRLGSQLASSAGFVANFYFWFQSGYFSPDARTLPLLHLWSLGVEEQFYIVWPLLLVAIRGKPPLVFRAIVAIGGASFLLNIALIDNHAADFYSPLTRAWELMAGAWLAWELRRQRQPVADAVADLATILGLAAILASVALLDSRFAYPGWLAVLPVAGSMLIVWAGANGAIARRLLSAPALVYVGKISYPLYLWHWPVLVFAAAYKFAPLTLLENLAALVGSFLLAALTYHFVEGRFRAGAIGRARIAVLGAGMAALAIAGTIVVAAQGFASRFPKEILALARPRNLPAEWRFGQCLIELGRQQTFAEQCLEHKQPLTFVWGDSVATALMPGLRELQRASAFGLAQFTPAGCPPLLDVDIPGSPGCRAINQTVLETVGRTRPEIVLLQGRGTYLPDERPALERTIVALRKLSVRRVVVIGPPPDWKRTLVNETLKYFVAHHEPIPLRYSQRVYRSWDDAGMRSFVTGLGAEYISMWDVLCNADGCLTRLGENLDDLVIYDQSHLTENGSRFFVEAVREKIVPRDVRP